MAGCRSASFFAWQIRRAVSSSRVFRLFCFFSRRSSKKKIPFFRSNTKYRSFILDSSSLTEDTEMEKSALAGTGLLRAPGAQKVAYQQIYWSFYWSLLQSPSQVLNTLALRNGANGRDWTTHVRCSIGD